MIPRRPIWRRRRKIKVSWWRRHNRGKGSYTQVEFQLTLSVGQQLFSGAGVVIIHEPLSYIFILIFAPNVAWGLLPLKLRSYIFRLKSRKAEDREVYTCTHEHSWKRGSHESKVSIPPSVPNLEIIKFTPFLLPLLLTTY